MPCFVLQEQVGDRVLCEMCGLLSFFLHVKELEIENLMALAFHKWLQKLPYPPGRNDPVDTADQPQTYQSHRIQIQLDKHEEHAYPNPGT